MLTLMVTLSVYGKGFLTRTESGHRGVYEILGSAVRPQVLRGFSEKVL